MNRDFRFGNLVCIFSFDYAIVSRWAIFFKLDKVTKREIP